MIVPHLCSHIRAAKDRLVVVTGTGVSVSLSGRAPAASWRGLLEHGVQRCLDESRMDAAAADQARQLIAQDDIDMLLAGADLVCKKLGAPDGHSYGRWLADSVGGLFVRNDELRGVFHQLQVSGTGIATTNYDHLLTELTGMAALCANQSTKGVEWLRGKKDHILHLHGEYQTPQGIVLGSSDYTRVVDTTARQELQKLLAGAHTLLFIGCGADGLTDPNIGKLLRWLQNTFSSGLSPHYCLCRDSEVANFRAKFGDRAVTPVGYGPDYADLAPALEDLFGLTPTSVSVSPPAFAAAAPPSAAPSCVYDSTRPALPPVFTGRDAYMHRMTRKMESQLSISLVAGPRLGKSSVLLNWAESVKATGRVVRQLNGDGPEGADPGSFVSAITGAPAPREIEAAATVLKGWLQRHALPGLPPVIMVDEADTLLRRFDRRFFERMRGCLERDLTLVLASRHTVDQIFAEHKDGSPFGPRMHTVFLSVLEPARAAALAAHAGAEAPLLLGECGGHPWFQNLLGSLLCSEPDAATALREFRGNAGIRLDSMWRDLSAADQKLLHDAFAAGRTLRGDRFLYAGWTNAAGEPFGGCIQEWLRDLNP